MACASLAARPNVFSRSAAGAVFTLILPNQVVRYSTTAAISSPVPSAPRETISSVVCCHAIFVRRIPITVSISWQLPQIFLTVSFAGASASSAWAASHTGSARATAAIRNGLRHRISDHGVGVAAVPGESAAGGGDDDVLSAVLALEGDGSGGRAGIHLIHPQLLAGLGIEGAEAAVVGRADEDQAAGGGERSADVRAPRVLLARRPP